MNANTQPEPAVGQVWRSKYGSAYVIDRVDEHSVTWRNGGWDALPMPDVYTCVGVETPHGRVMVGERRHMPDGDDWHVRGIGDGCVLLAPADVDGFDAGYFTKDPDSGLYPFMTEDVAQWPLVTEPAPSPNAGAWADAIAKADRQIERALLGRVSTPMLDSARVAYPFDRVSIGNSAPVPAYGSRAWLLAETMRIVPVPESEIGIVEEPGKGRVSVRLPARVHPNLATHLQQWLDSHGPAWLAISVFIDKTTAEPWEERRRIVSEHIDADARKCPTFATARRAAIAAAFEGAPPLPPVEDVPADVEVRLLAALHAYEANRGGDHKPRPYARKIAASVADPDTGAEGPMFVAAIETYERNRGRA